MFLLLKSYIQQDKSVVLAVVVRGPASLIGAKAVLPEGAEPAGPLLDTLWADRVQQDAALLLAEGASGVRRYPSGGEAEAVEVFFDVYRPAPRLVIVGAVHIASDLIRFARPLGYRTYLVDPRAAFATPERFPHVDELIQRWPDEALPGLGLANDTAVVVVTHDPKLDDPALLLALPSPAFYVGALGSPRTHARRVERLQEAGLSQAQLDRLHAPIGLDLGSKTPAEIALSIMAQIVAVRNNAPTRR